MEEVAKYRMMLTLKGGVQTEIIGNPDALALDAEKLISGEDRYRIVKVEGKLRNGEAIQVWVKSIDVAQVAINRFLVRE